MNTSTDTIAELRTALVELNPKQQAAVEALASGATHAASAEAAGVARETVTRWAGGHPGFRAALNLYRLSAATELADQITRIWTKAMVVIEHTLDTGNLSDALAVLRAVPAPGPIGPIDAVQILDADIRFTKQAQPSMSVFEQILDEAGTADQERAERSTIARLAAASGITE